MLFIDKYIFPDLITVFHQLQILTRDGFFTCSNRCQLCCVYACMPIRMLVHAYYSTFNPPLLYVHACDKYTRTHLHTHTHTLTCRKTQAFNPPFVTRTYTCILTGTCTCHMHMHIHTHATHTLTRLLQKGVRIWEGMVLCIRPSLAMSIHGAHWHTYVGAYD